MTHQLTMKFHGAAGTVTGSCMELALGARSILVDCGLFQGSRSLEALNLGSFGFDPRRIDAVILTHAHIDHCGLLPKLAAQGYEGAIWCTQATSDLLEFMLADAGSNRTYPEVEVRDGHHELSHHQKDGEKMEKISRIDRYLVERFAYFLEKLNGIQEGERSLLDNSMILYGSAISDGNRHNHDDLPIVLAGGGGGTIRSGRVLRFQEETPLNNLFVSMAHRMGANLDSIGDSKGELKELS